MHEPSFGLAACVLTVPDTVVPVCVSTQVTVVAPCESLAVPFHVPVRLIGSGGGGGADGGVDGGGDGDGDGEGDGDGDGGAAACVTVNVILAIVSVPLRAAPLLAAAA